MPRAKAQIKEIMKEYLRLFPGEYKSFLKSNAIRVDNLGASNKFAEMKGSEQVVRHLFEIPETLYFAFVRGLTDEELDWLYSRNKYEKDFRGMKWFMEVYPQFKVTSDF